MKNIALILSLCGIASIHAQSSSKNIEFYERYENGELVEERKSATENGVRIDGFDFDAFKAESLDKKDFGGTDNQNFDAKMAEMDQRMKEMQSKADEMFKTKMAEMDQRMKEMESRAAKMQADTEKRMNEGGTKKQSTEQPKLTPQPQNKPNSQGGSFREA